MSAMGVALEGLRRPGSPTLVCYLLSALSYWDGPALAPRHPWTPTLKQIFIPLPPSLLWQHRPGGWILVSFAAVDGLLIGGNFVVWRFLLFEGAW